jgi:iron complex outermembrane receptor protein
MSRFVLPLILALAVSTAHAQQVDVPPDSSEAGLDDLLALLDQEVETAATYSQRVQDAAASASVVTADEIKRLGYQTVAEALAYVRGFTITDDRNYVYAGVRGLSRPGDYNNRIAVLVDGVPVREGNTGSAPVGADLGMPMAAVERIEVIRGPGSALYGTGAMFAVVNVITKDVRTLDGVYGVASAGEYGSLRGEAVASTTLGAGAAVSVAVYGIDDGGPDVYFPEFDAPETNGGVAAGLDWEEGFGGIATVETGASRLTLRYTQRDKGVPTGLNGAAFAAPAWTRDRSATAALRTHAALSPRVTAFASAALHHSYHYGVYPVELGGTLYDFFDDSNSTAAEAEGRVQWDPSPAYRVVAGAEVLSAFQSRVRIYSEETTLLKVALPRESGGLYAQVEGQLTRTLSATAGLRADLVGEHGAVSPRGALVYTPDHRTSLKLVAGTAFRAPSPFELKYELDYTGRVVASDLNPERVATVEAIASREVLPGLRLEGTAFITHVNDLIITVADPEAGTDQFANIGRARTWGGEAGALAAVRGWRARASYGVQRATNPDTDELLSNAPVHVGKANAYGPLGRGLWLALGLRAESGRQTIYETETEPFAVADAALSVDVFDERGRVTLGVRNAFDADYALPGGFEHRQAAIPQRPRTAYLRLDVRF